MALANHRTFVFITSGFERRLLGLSSMNFKNLSLLVNVMEKTSKNFDRQRMNELGRLFLYNMLRFSSLTQNGY